MDERTRKREERKQMGYRPFEYEHLDTGLSRPDVIHYFIERNQPSNTAATPYRLAIILHTVEKFAHKKCTWMNSVTKKEGEFLSAWFLNLNAYVLHSIPRCGHLTNSESEASFNFTASPLQPWKPIPYHTEQYIYDATLQ